MSEHLARTGSSVRSLASFLGQLQLVSLQSQLPHPSYRLVATFSLKFNTEQLKVKGKALTLNPIPLSPCTYPKKGRSKVKEGSYVSEVVLCEVVSLEVSQSADSLSFDRALLVSGSKHRTELFTIRCPLLLVYLFVFNLPEVCDGR